MKGGDNMNIADTLNAIISVDPMIPKLTISVTRSIVTTIAKRKGIIIDKDVFGL